MGNGVCGHGTGVSTVTARVVIVMPRARRPSRHGGVGAQPCQGRSACSWARQFVPSGTAKSVVMGTTIRWSQPGLFGVIATAWSRGTPASAISWAAPWCLDDCARPTHPRRWMKAHVLTVPTQAWRAGGHRGKRLLSSSRTTRPVRLDSATPDDRGGARRGPDHREGAVSQLRRFPEIELREESGPGTVALLDRRRARRAGADPAAPARAQRGCAAVLVVETCGRTNCST